MCGCFDSVLVYGIRDEDRDRTADCDFLEAHGVQLVDFLMNYCNAIYGVVLGFNDILNKTETYHDAERTVRSFAIVLQKACPGDWPEPDFHVGVVGDIENCAHTIIRGA